MGLRRSAWVGAALAAAVAVSLGAALPAAQASSSGSGARSAPAAPASSAAPSGGTATWAEEPAATPNWIFPFASLAFYSVANLTDFQYLMFRPLYWFGSPTSTSPAVDDSLSLAAEPTWDGDAVTIDLKGWSFHDGQAVDAQSVIFWLNMMKAEKVNWAGYVPGQLPDNIVSYAAPGGATGDEVVTLRRAYNPEWFLYNELSQITPMPETWDVTSLSGSAGSGGCGAVAAGSMTGAATTLACQRVWKFDTDDNGESRSPKMAGDLATYASNPLWADGADGPWMLSGYDNLTGKATFVPNPDYSGPQKPTLASFVELPFVSASSEYSALTSGHGPDVGILPLADTPAKPAGTALDQPGPNAPALATTYNLAQAEPWEIDYFPINFDSTKGADGHAGAVFSQLSVRQALQELVNQPGIARGIDKGYATPTDGPVPVFPKGNGFASGVELEAGGPYPYNVAAAVKGLRANGWDVAPGGTTTCANAGTAAGDCGAGIPEGTPLSFTLAYAEGEPQLTGTVKREAADWKKAGITVKLVADTFDQVLSYAIPGTHNWDMLDWGGGWIFMPDYMPTGEQLFATGAGSNAGDYSNATNDRLITATNDSSGSAAFATWENFLAKQIPVIWQPLGSQEVEISKQLSGVTPVDTLGDLMPEYWARSSAS